MTRIFALLFLPFLFIPVSNPVTEPSANNWLDLSAVDTVRVSLFGREKPDQFHISAYGAEIRIESGSLKITLTEADTPLTIRRNGRLVELITPQRTYESTEWTILTTQPGSVRIRSQATGTRNYKGSLVVSANSASHLRVINKIDLETYVASVIGSEMNFTEMEALKAQAVVSRTYALLNLQRNTARDYDMTDYESSQMYLGEFVDRPWFLNAAMATHGEILTWSDMLILAAYSSTCGGVTSDNENVWSGRGLPFLRSVSDHDMCSISPHFEWEFSIEKGSLLVVFNNEHRIIPRNFELKTDKNGRVISVHMPNATGIPLEMTGNQFRLMLNRHFGPLSLKSTRFTLTDENGRFTFKGRGLGHGVGMCQWGARGFAQSGWNYSDILAFYFSGVKIVDYHTIESQKIAVAQ